MTFQPRSRRVGLIVPSSNVTMETEIPALLRARETVLADRFTFHSSRMRMKSVVKEELEAMDADSVRCAVELSDAAVEVQAYACLVAIMSVGFGYHRTSTEKLQKATEKIGQATPVLNSAGALGSFVSISLVGRLFDATGNYQSGMALLTAMALGAGALVFWLRVNSKRSADTPMPAGG